MAWLFKVHNQTASQTTRLLVYPSPSHVNFLSSNTYLTNLWYLRYLLVVSILMLVMKIWSKLSLSLVTLSLWKFQLEKDVDLCNLLTGIFLLFLSSNMQLPANLYILKVISEMRRSLLRHKLDWPMNSGQFWLAVVVGHIGSKIYDLCACDS